MKLKFLHKYIFDILENSVCNLLYKDLNIMDSCETIEYIKKIKSIFQDMVMVNYD